MCRNHDHSHGDVNDYKKAVAEYRKTFPSKQDVIDHTPDPAVRDMIVHMGEVGLETPFDRFDKQKPHCGFGLAGVCCRICNMGPCKITEKSPKGFCGADADLIVSRNMLRAVAGGVSQHGMHAREVIMALKYAAEGKLNLKIVNEEKVKNTAVQFGLETEGKSVNQLAAELADILLEDLSRTIPGEHRTIKACAPPEHQKVWKDMDIIPISAYHEVFEALHRSGSATDGDWENIMQQFLRCGLSFVFSGVVGANIATDCLFGTGHRMTAKTNIGALEKDYVNIAVHGHHPMLVSQIVKMGKSETFTEKAKAAGAKGIRFYGICCSGLAAMYRNEGVVPLSNAIGAELVLGTGALDLWVADVQDVFPAIMDVARCYKTVVVTTSDSARLPGAEHYGFDHENSNMDEADALAEKIVTRAIESFSQRRDVPVFIPPYEVEAEIGFSVEYINHRYGGMEPLAEALKKGDILGIVNIVGCNNPKVIYERAIVDVAEEMLKNNILILTNGCASFPLLKLGFCHPDARSKCGEGLRRFLDEDMPPAWHMGECIDNTRASGVFAGIANVLGQRITDMPYAMSSPEWGNEKGIGASLAFRLFGVNSYHCVEAPIYGSDRVMDFMKRDTVKTLGSCMKVDTDPKALAALIVADMKEKRKALGWD